MAEHAPLQSDGDAEAQRLERLRIARQQEDAINRALAEAREEAERRLVRGEARTFRRQAVADGWDRGAMGRAFDAALVVGGLVLVAGLVLLCWYMYTSVRQALGPGR